jgi:hypothetical protein
LRKKRDLKEIKAEIELKGLKLLKNTTDRSFVHIEGDSEGKGPFTWKYAGVSLQLIVCLEALILNWKDELLQIVQGGDDEHTEAG